MPSLAIARPGEPAAATLPLSVPLAALPAILRSGRRGRRRRLLLPPGRQGRPLRRRPLLLLLLPLLLLPVLLPLLLLHVCCAICQRLFLWKGFQVAAAGHTARWPGAARGYGSWQLVQVSTQQRAQQRLSLQAGRQANRQAVEWTQAQNQSQNCSQSTVQQAHIPCQPRTLPPDTSAANRPARRTCCATAALLPAPGSCPSKSVNTFSSRARKCPATNTKSVADRPS
jgi:hypothetical protein